MADEHAGGNAAHAAGHRGDSVHDGLHFFIDRVSRNGAQATFGIGLFFIPVDGYVYYLLSGPYIRLGQAAQLTGGGNAYIRLAGNGGGVHRLGMADGDGGVFRQ